MSSCNVYTTEMVIGEMISNHCSSSGGNISAVSVGPVRVLAGITSRYGQLFPLINSTQTHGLPLWCCESLYDFSPLVISLGIDSRRGAFRRHRKGIYLRSAWRSQQTFLFLFCFFFFFIILFYFSLQPPACCDFSIISQPISMKFGMLIVLDETNRLNIFSSQ